MKTVSIVLFNITDGHGTDRAVSQLANLLAASGDYRINVISCLSKPEDRSYFDLHPAVTLYNLGFALKTKLDYFGIIRRIAQICRQTQTDFVLGTTHALNSILIGVRMRHLKRIACEHMNYDAAPLYSRAIRRIAYKKLDALVLLTESDRAHYRFHPKTCVIPNAIPTQTASASLKNPVFLAIGRYTEQKGFDLLIEAFSKMHPAAPQWQLRIVGSGEDEPQYRRLIEKYGLTDAVCLVPPTKQIAEEYLNAGVYVLSSRWEGFGLVLAEAKSFGLPSVAFNCKEGPADILRDGTDGFLVPPNDIDALANRMAQLANDETLRARFGQAAKQDAVRYAPETIFQKWDALFRSF